MASVDWQINKPQVECIQYMLDNQINCDVNFKIGKDQEIIKAHTFILSMRSPVFDRMFNGGFEESKKDPVIPDVTAAAFKALLRYCYYECLDFEYDIALDVLCAAKKYVLPLLEEAAREDLIEVLDETDIWEVYGYAVSVGDTELHDACKVYFTGDVTPVREALQTEAFLNIAHQVLLDFLHINDIDDEVQSSTTKSILCKNNVGISISEVELFKACNAWAEAECLRQEINPTGANKRTVLGECLFLIRFPTILYKDLVNVVYSTDILIQTEKDDLCQYKHSETGSESQVDFLSKERKFVVATSDSLSGSEIKPVSIESTVRVLLSRVWTTWRGKFRVTVRDEGSDRSWSRQYDTKHEGHITETYHDKKTYTLYFIDMEPEVLKPDTRYSIIVERLEKYEHQKKVGLKKLTIQKADPYKEVETTMSDPIYGLTLSLV